jgi:hypothetical protein
VNVVVLWNTFYMEAALRQLRKQGDEVNREDVERLSPLGYEHMTSDIHFSRLTTIRIPVFVASVVHLGDPTLTPCNVWRLDGHRRTGEETDGIDPD